jgi:hypothetical protein
MRILFAVGPSGTALLIAVLEDSGAVRDQYDDAVLLSLDLLRRAEAGQVPEAAACSYDDAQSFLGEFFAADADDVMAAAALLASRPARTLREQRARLGLTRAQVAERMNLPQEGVSAIESAEPGATEIATLARYVEALGGRLEIVAEISGERVVLR